MFIDISAQIGALTPAEQNRLFKKIATFLSVRELNAVMEDVAQGYRCCVHTRDLAYSTATQPISSGAWKRPAKRTPRQLDLYILR